MAKSLRSKWRRKMRAIRRQKFYPKELERLKNTVSQDSDVQPDVRVCRAASEPMDVEEEKRPETEGRPQFRKFPGTSRRYPVWMHPRKVKKLASYRRKAEQKRKKRRNE